MGPFIRFAAGAVLGVAALGGTALRVAAVTPSTPPEATIEVRPTGAVLGPGGTATTVALLVPPPGMRIAGGRVTLTVAGANCPTGTFTPAVRTLADGTAEVEVALDAGAPQACAGARVSWSVDASLVAAS